MPLTNQGNGTEEEEEGWQLRGGGMVSEELHCSGEFHWEFPLDVISAVREIQSRESIVQPL